MATTATTRLDRLTRMEPPSKSPHAVAACGAKPRIGLEVEWVGAGSCLALLGWAFWSDLRDMVHTWSTDGNYSHGFLVPLISLYFARDVARRGAIPRRAGVVLGSVLLALAIVGKLVTLRVPVGFVAQFSFVLGIAGICALLAGTEAVRRFGFAIFFLIFMIPLPIALYSAIASPLQILVSRAASALLNAIGIPVLCQGNLMTLPGDVRMFVAEACSGMRQLTGFLALTTAVAFMSGALTTSVTRRKPLWYRAMLIASSIPIALAANVVRVMLTGIIMYHVDPSYASGSFHTIEGLLMMGLGLAMLSGECRLLNFFVPDTAPPASSPPSEPSQPASERRELRIGLGRLALGLALLLLGLAAEGAVETDSETTRPTLKQPLKAIPLQIGKWVGQDRSVEPDVLERSQTDDYLSRTYEDRSHPGRRLTLWLNYSRHGLNLRHSPEVCLPGQGYAKVESQCRTLSVPRAGRESLPVTRLVYAQGELVQGVGFWYYIFGEGELEHFVRGLPITSRSSYGRATRGSGLTVEIFCPGEADPEGEALREFATALLEVLEPLLPDKRDQYFIP
jgi:exosortase